MTSGSMCLSHVFPGLTAGPYRSRHFRVIDGRSQRVGKREELGSGLDCSEAGVRSGAGTLPWSEPERCTDK